MKDERKRAVIRLDEDKHDLLNAHEKMTGVPTQRWLHPVILKMLADWKTGLSREEKKALAEILRGRK